MPSFSVSSALLNLLVSIGACLFVAAMVFSVMAARRREWGSVAVVAAMLTIAIIGWIFSLQEGYLSISAPDLEISDRIETTGGGTLYLTWLTALNRGAGTARNCVVEIEHRFPWENEYQYLGYAVFERERLMPHTESRFWLLRTRSHDEGIHWETSIMLRDIRDDADARSSVTSRVLLEGERYLKLTIIAQNAASHTREFKLYVPEDKTELPKLEALPQTTIQTEH